MLFVIVFSHRLLNTPIDLENGIFIFSDQLKYLIIRYVNYILLFKINNVQHANDIVHGTMMPRLPRATRVYYCNPFTTVDHNLMNLKAGRYGLYVLTG